MKQIPYSFECEPYGDFSAVTPLISKGRLRVYYKGLNRNGGYITDEFSTKLEKSLPYTPVVGDYDEFAQDFKGHNLDRNVAVIYGIVPENPNIAWEPHEDKDGITRVYLCCDVYLYTGRYDAAKEIIGKHHSMELNRDSLKGDWERRGIDEVFVYQDAFFDGLCVLGDDIEPCFEGSGFFSHETGAIKILEDYVRNKTNNLEDLGLGGNSMEEEKILDSEIRVEDEAEIETSSDFEENKVPTTGPEEDEGTEQPKEEQSVEEVLVEETPAEVSGEEESPVDPEADADPTENELQAEEETPISDAVKVEEDEDEEEEEKKKEEEEDEDYSCGLTLDASFEEIKNCFPVVAEEFENLNNKILEFSADITTLETRVGELESSLAVYQQKEQEQLDAQKDQLLEEYSKYLDEEALDDIRANASNYTVENLEKELLFTVKKANPNFLKVQEGATFASLRTQGEEGIYRILKNYKEKQKR